MPLADEDSSNNEVVYFIEKLPTTDRWDIRVYSISYRMNRNMYIETHQHGSYVKHIAGPRQEREKYSFHIPEQLSALLGGTLSES
jgi:hypothetical protein